MQQYHTICWTQMQRLRYKILATHSQPCTPWPCSESLGMRTSHGTAEDKPYTKWGGGGGGPYNVECPSHHDKVAP